MPAFWRRAAARPRITDSAWQHAWAAHPFLHGLDAEDRRRLREACETFLADKQFSGEAGLDVDDRIGLSIAVQACLPVLRLGLSWYDDFRQIIVYPDQFLVPRREIDDSGLVHEEDVWLAGETMDGGPVILSWADAAPGAVDGVFNVVIHEFVHKLDLRDGQADGVPPMAASRRGAWASALHDAFDRFNEQIDALEASIPDHVDPDSDEGQSYFDALPIDPYAAQDPAEFFAVAGETYFLAPAQLERAFPDLTREFERFFGFRLPTV